VLVQRHQASQRARIEFPEGDDADGAIARMDLVARQKFDARGRQLARGEFGSGLLHGVAEGEGFGLGEAIGLGQLGLRRVVARRLRRQQEIERRARRALVQHLEEGVLRVVAGFAPDHRRRLVTCRFTGEIHGLAVAFHVELLQVGREAPQASVVRQHRERRQLQQVDVPRA
jgi:hypothetical protein